MINKPATKPVLMLGSILFLASIACQALFPTVIKPGSLEAEIAEGNLRFLGSGNITYIGCQDPTAAVTIAIGAKTKVIDGQELNTYVNPVTLNAITNGSQVRMGECQKTNLDEKFDWPARGIYYPLDGKIIFYTCTQNNDRAEGEGFLVGEGFEGEYACYDSDGDLMYQVAFSAYELSR